MAIIRGQGCVEEDKARESGYSDMENTASRLTSCYNKLWETEKWPKVWKKGACC